jgi:5,10-methylenetetrahydrofolate reductase
MSRLAESIAARRFAITTELTPPKGIDLADLLRKATALAARVDGINLTESPRARMAIEPKSVARLLLERGGEPIVQFTARDRNRIAIQADILGAAALGIENVVFMRGDDPRIGDQPAAKPVFDLTTTEMLEAVVALMHGRDLAGNEISGAPQLFPGATANPGAADFEAEVANTRAKIAAGARFLQTQAVYSAAAFERFIAAVQPEGVAVLAGIIPLKSFRMASWLDANVPGIRVPHELLRELEAVAGDSAQERRLGLEITARVIRAVRPIAAGVHLMMMGWEDRIPELLAASGVCDPA